VRPDATTARRYVLVSMVGLLGLAAYKGKLDQSLAKRLWGVGVLGMMLTLAADVAPSVAGPFALLILVGYATSSGDKAIQNFLGKVSGGAPSTPSQAPSGNRPTGGLAHPAPSK
jgi:hypothetical protein